MKLSNLHMCVKQLIDEGADVSANVEIRLTDGRANYVAVDLLRVDISYGATGDEQKIYLIGEIK